MLAHVRRALREDCRVRPGSAVLVALSGGPDSTALLVALAEIAPRLRLALHAAHLHHGLRGAEADADLAAVRSLCLKLGVPLHAARWDTRARMARRGLKGQAGLRVLRREYLLLAARRAGARYVATGHTAQDQAETLLLRLARGSGLPGLAGILPRSGRFVRPLLQATRGEVERFLRARGFDWREDSSNRDLRYARNAVRALVIPALARAQGLGGPAALARRAGSAAREAAALRTWLTAEARRALAAALHPKGHDGHLDRVLLGEFPAPIRRAALRLAWRRSVPGGPGLTAHHLDALERLLDPKAGPGPVALPAGRRARREGRHLVVERKSERTAGAEPVAIRPPGRVRWNGERIAAQWVPGALARRHCDRVERDEAYFAADGLRGVPALRQASPDETFTPFGRAHATRLGSFLKKQSIPASGRTRPLVLADEAGILWVVGVRRAARAPVTGTTRRALHVRWEAHA
jgi:tRNA(Ile)-lysidine synthase